MRKSVWQIPLVILVLVAVWVLNASRPGATLEGSTPSGPQLPGVQATPDAPADAGDEPSELPSAGEASAKPLRLVSLNVLHGFPRFGDLRQRLDLIAAGLIEAEPDVVCLQEVPWTRALGNGAAYLAERTGYKYLYIRANGNRRTILFEEGEAILSRYPLHDPAFVQLRPRAGFFEHRMALHAVVAAPGGDVAVFVTHLTHGEAQVNAAQAADLQAFVDETLGAAGTVAGAVICGDFNATADSPQIRTLTATWIDTFRAAQPNAEGHTCCVDKAALSGALALEQRLSRRIDYVFVRPVSAATLVVQDARTLFDAPVAVGNDWQWVSDHAGLLVELAP